MKKTFIWQKGVNYVLLAVLFLIIGFLFGLGYRPQIAIAPQPENSNSVQPSKVASLTIEFDSNNLREVENIYNVQGQTVLELLKTVAQENNLPVMTRDYGSLGVMVTQIGDKINGQDNKYWQYYINGKYSEIGAGSYKLTGSEKIDWRFEANNYQK